MSIFDSRSGPPGAQDDSHQAPQPDGQPAASRLARHRKPIIVGAAAAFICGGAALVLWQAHSPAGDAPPIASATEAMQPQTIQQAGEVGETPTLAAASVITAPAGAIGPEEPARIAPVEAETVAEMGDVPPVDDARWAADSQVHDSAAARRLAEMLGGEAADGPATANAFAPLLGGERGSIGQDRSQRGLAVEAANEVPVAESDAEVAAIEADLMRENAPGFEESVAGARTARTNNYVNMRAGADIGSRVLTVVPSGAEIALRDDCPNWCAVEYQGMTGYIYGSYVTASGG